jgi:hypothetical protein
MQEKDANTPEFLRKRKMCLNQNSGQSMQLIFKR